MGDGGELVDTERRDVVIPIIDQGDSVDSHMKSFNIAGFGNPESKAVASHLFDNTVMGCQCHPGLRGSLDEFGVENLFENNNVTYGSFLRLTAFIQLFEEHPQRIIFVGVFFLLKCLPGHKLYGQDMVGT